MPKFDVSKSIVINAPLEKVYATVRDFRQWQPWSPWLIAEPGCKVEYAEDGKSYSWDGEIVGAGTMEIVGEEAPRAIDYRLSFLKPWKSRSDVSFRFAEKDGGVEATWTMEGALPFFLFFMKKMMTAFVGMDYERGLNMLKDYVETGSVPSALEFPGEKSFPGQRYLGIRRRCSLSDLGPSMEGDMEKLKGWVEEAGATPAGPMFSIYYKFNPVAGVAEYALGVPLDSPPAEAPGGFVVGEIPACKAYAIKHTGSYRHLGNAWSAGVFHGRAKKYAKNRKQPPFEIYENHPGEVEEKDLVTVVHFVTK